MKSFLNIKRSDITSFKDKLTLPLFDIERGCNSGTIELPLSSSLRDRAEAYIVSLLIKEGKSVAIPFFMDDIYSAMVGNEIFHLVTDSEDERRVGKLEILTTMGYRATVIRSRAIEENGALSHITLSIIE